MSFTNRSVVVTGGTSGIGKGIARAFAAAGARVLITGRDRGRAEAAARELDTEAAGGSGRVTCIVGDISSPTHCADVAAAAGRVDVLVCNAGLMPAQRVSGLRAADIEACFATNVKGTMLAVQACAAALSVSGHGRVVLISSITGPLTGMAGWSTYGASKAAQLGFMRSAALELAADKITVNAICPGNIRTEGLAALGVRGAITATHYI